MAKITAPPPGDLTYVEVKLRAKTRRSGRRLPKLVLPRGSKLPSTLGAYTAVERLGKRRNTFVATIALLNRKPRSRRARASAGLVVPFVTPAALSVVGTRQVAAILTRPIPIAVRGFRGFCPTGNTTRFYRNSRIPIRTRRAIRAACDLAQRRATAEALELVGAIGGTIPPGFFPSAPTLPGSLGSPPVIPPPIAPPPPPPPPPDQTFALAFDQVVTPGSLGSGSGSIESAGAIDRYTFSVNGARTAFFDVQAVDGGCSGPSQLRWTLERVSDSTTTFPATGLAQCGGDKGPIALPAGSYQLRVDAPPGSGGTGTYGFKVWDVPADQAFDINFGDTVSNGQPGPGAGNVEEPGRSDIYRFTATAGQKALIDLQGVGGSCTGAGTTLRWSLRKQGGAAVFSDKSLATCDDPDPAVLEAGTYELAVKAPANDDETGTYKFALRDATPWQTFDIGFGDTVSDGAPGPGAGRLESSDAVDAYTFEAVAGQKAFFDIQDIGATSDCDYSDMTWKLERPDGTIAFSGVGLGLCQGDRGPVPIDQTGTYRLLVSEPSTSTQTKAYRFRLTKVDPPDVSTIDFGDTVNGNIEKPGQEDDYTFTAAAGDRAFLDIQHVGDTPDCDYSDLQWSLVEPDGTTKRFDPTGIGLCQGDRGPVNLPVAGPYTLRVVAPVNNDDFKTYRFRLTKVDPPDVSTIDFGDTVNGNIEKPGQEDDYTFTAAAGDGAFFDIQHVGDTPDCDYSGLEWSLTAEDGTKVFDGVGLGLCTGDRTVTLPQNGTYTLRVVAPANDDSAQKYVFALTHAASVTVRGSSSQSSGNWSSQGTLPGDVVPEGGTITSCPDKTTTWVYFEFAHFTNGQQLETRWRVGGVQVFSTTTTINADSGRNSKALLFKEPSPNEDYEVDFVLDTRVIATGHVTRDCPPAAKVHGWSTTENSSWEQQAQLPSGTTPDGGTITSCTSSKQLVAYMQWSGFPSQVTETWLRDGTVESSGPQTLDENGRQARVLTSADDLENGTWELRFTDPANNGQTLFSSTVVRNCP